jgi:hypothetical protein
VLVAYRLSGRALVVDEIGTLVLDQPALTPESTTQFREQSGTWTGRLTDRADIVELVKRGIDIEGCREYLRRNAAESLAEFEKAVATAQAESE